MIRPEVLTVTCPAGTPEATPIETPFTFAAGQVRTIEITIPAGHAFTTGIAIAASHTPVLPWTAGGYLIGDDDHLSYDIIDPLQNGAWSVFTYNTDRVNPHSWQIRWLVKDLATIPKPQRLTLLPPAAIYGAALGQINQG
jgi:hypothetical protein